MDNNFCCSRNDGYKLSSRVMSYRFTCKLFLSILMLLLGLEMKAQGPPIFTDTPIMLGVQGRGVRTFGNIISKENANAYAQVLVVPYNITSKWQVDVVVPYLSISPDAGDSRSGFGDLKVFTKYQLYKKDGKGKTLRSLFKLTETFPTGNTSKVPALGSGAYQTTLSLVNGYVTTKLWCLWRSGLQSCWKWLTR